MPPAVIMPSRLQPLDCPSGRRHYVCHMLAYDSISGMQLSGGDPSEGESSKLDTYE
jgi:hypothetical protein